MRREVDIQQNYMTNQPFSRVQSLKGKLGIIFFVWLMPTCCLIFIQFWFLETLKSNMFEYYAAKYGIYFIYAMCFISYYQTLALSCKCPKNKIPKLEMKSRPIPGIDESYTSLKYCDRCNGNWKPSRTHHCSTCQMCIGGMDHHCPWTVCCVGYRNHKSFLLFSIYMFIGSAMFCYDSIKFAFYESNQGTFWEHTFFFYAFWAFTNIILYPTCIGLLMIILFHGQMACANVKTMETMKGMSLPCQGPPPEQTGAINPFDIGFFANLQEFFGRNIFLFWFPIEVSNNHQCTDFPMIPLATKAQIDDGYKMMNLPQEIHYNFEELKKIAKEQYSHAHLQFLNKIYDPLNQVKANPEVQNQKISEQQ